jgi:hypothetical protein
VSVSDIQLFSFTTYQLDNYRKIYGIDESKIHLVGIPRHDTKWIKRIQAESCALPDGI